MTAPDSKAILRPLLLAAVLALAAGCSLPRVTVYDDPLSDEEHLTLGASYEEQGQLELAETQYEKADDLPVHWLFLGNVAFRQQRWDVAEKRYEKAMRLLPDDPRPPNNLAWMYHVRGMKLARAEELARMALEMAPEGEKGNYRETLDTILAQRADRAREQ